MVDDALRSARWSGTAPASRLVRVRRRTGSTNPITKRSPSTFTSSDAEREQRSRRRVWTASAEPMSGRGTRVAGRAGGHLCSQAGVSLLGVLFTPGVVHDSEPGGPPACEPSCERNVTVTTGQ